MRIAISLALIAFVTNFAAAAEPPKWPIIRGEPWTVATSPDLGELTTDKQQPVDFAVWPAADGTWQLWSCIRGTKEPGKTRLFYRWEGAKLEDRNWRPMGIAMQADPRLGETAGGLQAPHVIRHDGAYHMFYGDWEHICSGTSADGKTFTRRPVRDGKPQLFGEAAGSNTRDAMVLRIGDVWHCYYTAYPNDKGSVYCRTSKDMVNWSDSRIVAAGGQAGGGKFSAECPFVVELTPGEFYLFRTQRYGQNAVTSVYRSNDPQDFGVNQDEGHFVGTLPVAAPEIIRHNGRWYMAWLLPSLKGIQIAEIDWVAKAAKQ